MSNENGKSNNKEETNYCVDDSGVNYDCKYFHHDPFMTPNNFDLYLDYHSIPVNIEVDATYDLVKRLSKYLPLSKKLHLNLNSTNSSTTNGFNLNSRIKIKFKTNNNTIVEKYWDEL